jgi:hypothetical protein
MGDKPPGQALSDCDWLARGKVLDGQAAVAILVELGEVALCGRRYIRAG